MAQALNRFERYLRFRFSHSSTPQTYLGDVRIFLRNQGDRRMESITAADIDIFVDAQVRAGLSPATVNRRLTSLSCFFEFLAGEEPDQAWTNPIIRRRHALKQKRHLPRDAADEEVERLFAKITEVQNKALFGLMLDAGLRVSEVSGLQIADLDFTSEVPQVRVRGKGGKERIVWLTAAVANNLKVWLRQRPSETSGALFLNCWKRPITVTGIQYRLRRICQKAGVKITCHQLRHTYARRLVENGMPVESLARLLGHSHLASTQRYIEGADPSLQAEFKMVMAKLETTLVQDSKKRSIPSSYEGKVSPRLATEEQFRKLSDYLEQLPPWLADGMAAYLRWRWPTWRAQTAYKLGRDICSLVKRIWTWLEANRQVRGWETFRRADLEAWLFKRQQDNVSRITIRNDLAQFRSVLRFLESRDYALDPGLFRVRPPRLDQLRLPRALSEADYGWLETNVMQATREDVYDAKFDRAWFLMLAHTGLRLAELLDLRMGDLNYEKGMAQIRGGKAGRDRIVYLTPALSNALARYLEVRPNLADEDRVFVLHGRSPHSRSIQRRLEKYGRQAEVSVTPHQLRHTFATRLLNASLPLYALRKLLGHRDLNTTQIYARLYDETLYKQFQEATSRLESTTKVTPRGPDP